MTAEEVRKKSVSFSEGIHDEDGIEQKLGGESGSAQNHSMESTDLKDIVDGVRELKTDGAEDAAGEDAAFDPAKLKKKKKKVAKEDDGVAPTEDAGFDATALKKKKKKKVAAAPESSFDQKLAEAGVVPVDGEEAPAAPPPVVAQTPEEEAEDLANGTGMWQQSSNAKLPYSSLLKRFFTLLHDQHPDLAGDGRSKSYKIPPPQVLREGNKKTIFANLPEICRKMKRQPEHVIQFLFAELGTSGSVDGNGRLVIKGRFQQKQLENVIRHYIVEYLTCRTCKSPDTVLNKENRLYFITCNSCGSRRSVTTIKTGFQATVGKRKRMQT